MNRKIMVLIAIISVVCLAAPAIAVKKVTGIQTKPIKASAEENTYASSASGDYRYNYKFKRWEFKSDSGDNYFAGENNNLYTEGNAVYIIDFYGNFFDNGRPQRVSDDKIIAAETYLTGQKIFSKDGLTYYTGPDNSVYYTNDKECSIWGGDCKAYKYGSTYPVSEHGLANSLLASGSTCTGGDQCLSGICHQDKMCMTQMEINRMAAGTSWDITQAGTASDMWSSFMVGANFGMEISRLFGWDGGAWAEGMTQFFTQNAFGQFLSGNWELSFCNAKFYKSSNEQGVIVTTGNRFYYGLHIQAFRSELGSFYNESTGQWENMAMYLVTYRVQNTNEEDNSYNIYFYEANDPVGIPFYTNQNGAVMDKELEGGESYSVSIDSAIAAQSDKVYVKVCLKLSDPIKDYNNKNQDEFCNKIVETTSNEGVDIEELVGGTGESFVPVQGQNPRF